MQVYEPVSRVPRASKRVRYKSPDQVRLEIETLAELLREARAQNCKNPSIAVRRKIVYLDREIEVRRCY